MPRYIFRDPTGWFDLQGLWRTAQFVDEKPIRNRTLYRWCVRCGMKTPETHFFVLRGNRSAPAACAECAEIINQAGTVGDYVLAERKIA